MNNSLGLVEIKGFCATIFTADAILKNSKVEIGLEEINNGNMILKLKGSLPQIKYAINLAVESANKISSVVNHTVLENLNSEIERAFFVKSKSFIRKEKPKKSKTFKAEIQTENSEEEKIITPVKSVSSKRKQNPRTAKVIEKSIEFKKPTLAETNSSTIERLRLEALGKKVLKASGEISDKTLKTKTYDIKKLSDLDGLNVHKLRRAARDFEEFPIKGRQISMASREELMVYFKQILPE